MATGTVKWFNNAKGWGFIQPDEGNEDVFVHFSSIQSTGFKTLKIGERVDYSFEKGQKGFHALEVRILEGEHAGTEMHLEEAEAV